MTIGIITARGGSKGIPNKNLVFLGGKTLIEYTFEVANLCPALQRIFLTTDSKEIMELARAKYPRIEIIARPPELAQDTSSHVDVINHLLTHLQKDLSLQIKSFALFQPTSPFRKAGEIQEAVTIFQNQGLKSLLGVVPVMHHPADYIWRSRDSRGPFHEVVERAPGVRRQDLPEVYFISGALFICDSEWYWKNQRFYDSTSHLFKMSEETLLDIDTPFDLRLARGYLMASSSEAQT